MTYALHEPLLEIFDYGSPPFTRLLGEFRRRTIEAAAAAGTCGSTTPEG